MRLHWFQGAAAIALGIFGVFAISFVLVLFDADAEHWPRGLTGLVATISGIVLLWCGGFLMGRPVGLRMDRDGVSGYLLPPILWSRVIEVGLYKTPRFDRDSSQMVGDDNLFLALRLNDPQTWWREVTVVQRFCGLTRSWDTHWDLLLPLGALSVDDPKSVIHMASDLHEGR
jgi:hypothetical protein